MALFISMMQVKACNVVQDGVVYFYDAGKGL